MSLALELGLTPGPAPAPYAYALAGVSLYDKWVMVRTLRKQWMSAGYQLVDADPIHGDLSFPAYEKALRSKLIRHRARESKSAAQAVDPPKPKSKKKKKPAVETFAVAAGDAKLEVTRDRLALQTGLDSSIEEHFEPLLTIVVARTAPVANKMVVLFSRGDKVGVAPYACATKYARELGCSHVTLVSKGKPTSNVAKLMAADARDKGVHVRACQHWRLLVDVHSNCTVQTHTPLSDKEAAEFLNHPARKLTREQLPRILKTDPVIEHLDLPLDTVVRRDSFGCNPVWMTVTKPV